MPAVSYSRPEKFGIYAWQGRIPYAAFLILTKHNLPCPPPQRPVSPLNPVTPSRLRTDNATGGMGGRPSPGT